MKLNRRLLVAIKALHELGLGSLGFYTLYQIGLATGHYRRQLASSLKRLARLNSASALKTHPCLPGLPDQGELTRLLGDQIKVIYTQADEIVNGKVRLFSGQAVPLVLTPPVPLADWTHYEAGNSLADGQDIKFIWEAGRFGWAYMLAMAYHLSGNQRYAEAFWQNSEQFLAANPPFWGPHWASAQEVAIRLVALAFCLQAFNGSPHSTPARRELLAKSIAIHAERIPPTLVYARSQNNNHLISEALGLYTASAVLRDHPLSTTWYKLGWKWLIFAFRTQISQDGVYMQHSANYHRLMLQAALWTFAVHEQVFNNEPLPEQVVSHLTAATVWLVKLIDPQTGCAPNLGHNDGSYILPLTVCTYQDYRPIIHAAACMFLHIQLDPEGPWDDLGAWLVSKATPAQTRLELSAWRVSSTSQAAEPPHVIQSPLNDSWAYFRSAQFHTRPAHADLLHLDLWWHGLNICQDAGTYLYNASPPWDNALTSIFVHNVISVDDQEYMLRAGRFLYLDWPCSRILETVTDPHNRLVSMTADHNGYQKMGIRYTRKVTACHDGRWEVLDLLEGPNGSTHTAKLHWLLPDWEYEISDSAIMDGFSGGEIRIKSPFGWISLQTELQPDASGKPITPIGFIFARAGALLHGSDTISPITGWISPTYGEKKPALAFIVKTTQPLPIEIKSTWKFPDES
jgi:hypothetical protein